MSDFVSRVMFAVRHPVRAARRVEYQRRGARRIARKGIRFTEDALGHRGYQNLYGVNYGRSRDVDPTRSTSDRWEMMSIHLPTSGCALDVGANNGWFTFKLAEHGLVALGVDVSERAVRLAQWLSVYNESDRAAFLRLDIGPGTVEELPSVDVTLCLSVFHHWVRHNDLAYAMAIMKGLADQCRGLMVFETGQPDEPNRDWADQLSFMGVNPKRWIEQMLMDIGFQGVEHLGVTPGFQGGGSRHLMVARKRQLP